MAKSLLTKTQRDAAKALLAARPAVIPGTRVCIDRAKCTEWFSAVSLKIKDMGVAGHGVGEFCDIAGVPD